MNFCDSLPRFQGKKARLLASGSSFSRSHFDAELLCFRCRREFSRMGREDRNLQDPSGKLGRVERKLESPVVPSQIDRKVVPATIYNAWGLTAFRADLLFMVSQGTIVTFMFVPLHVHRSWRPEVENMSVVMLPSPRRHWSVIDTVGYQADSKRVNMRTCALCQIHRIFKLGRYGALRETGFMASVKWFMQVLVPLKIAQVDELEDEYAGVAKTS
ncbi:hypothetical protein VNO77_27066 [Canavalia gladiata]|uniref:Uncharacterized protein n=1 Tax=Canavalia gladiata TaxID=3824 RepID=A0AAN9KX58_CANGL